MKVLQSGITQFPENTDLLYDYAMDAEKNNQLDICETSLRKIIALAPENQQAYNALGYTFAERNVHLDEALRLIETALKLSPDDPFIIDSMGWVQFRLGKLKEAEDYLRRAYAMRQDPEIAVHLGEVLWFKGQKADAHKVWRDAISKDPDNDSLKSTLARLHVSL
jgi:Flp pilus assembly protein TadD